MRECDYNSTLQCVGRGADIGRRYVGSSRRRWDSGGGHVMNATGRWSCCKEQKKFMGG